MIKEYAGRIMSHLRKGKGAEIYYKVRRFDPLGNLVPPAQESYATKHVWMAGEDCSISKEADGRWKIGPATPSGVGAGGGMYILDNFDSGSLDDNWTDASGSDHFKLVGGSLSIKAIHGLDLHKLKRVVSDNGSIPADSDSWPGIQVGDPAYTGASRLMHNYPLPAEVLKIKITTLFLMKLTSYQIKFGLPMKIIVLH